MKKLIVAVAASCVLPLFSGCAGLAFSGRGVPMGFLYAGTEQNEKATDNPLGGKHGESCASSILGLITTGDASAATAARNAGITKISAVDSSSSNVLGIYSSYCVKVSGQ